MSFMCYTECGKVFIMIHHALAEKIVLPYDFRVYHNTKGHSHFI
jgi:hypothetical protein